MAELALQARAAGPAAAHRGRPPRPARRPLRLALAGAGLAAAVVTGVLALGGNPSLGTPAFAVTAPAAGTVDIHIVNSEASAAQMIRQLRAAAGVDVTIRTHPVSPQLVGTWIGFGTRSQQLDASLRRQTRGYASTLTVPTTDTGHLLLDIGRAAAPGEGVEVSGVRNALAPGGRLFCARLSGSSPADAAAALAQRDYTVGWRTRAGAVPAPPAGSRVVRVEVPDAETPTCGTAAVHVVAPGDPAYEDELWEGWSDAARTTGRPDYSSCG